MYACVCVYVCACVRLALVADAILGSMLRVGLSEEVKSGMQTMNNLKEGYFSQRK